MRGSKLITTCFESEMNSRLEVEFCVIAVSIFSLSSIGLSTANGLNTGCEGTLLVIFFASPRAQIAG